MSRGFFTQSTTVLFEQGASLDAIASAFGEAGFEVERRETKGGWLSGGVELLIPFGEQPRGHVHVDMLAEPWPDSMGDPKENVELFGAWSMGAFGPLAFPGNLARATEQAVAFPGAAEVAGRHSAFVRLRTSYLVGAGEEAPIMPEGWSPLAEIDALIQVAMPVLGLEGASAYFDPNAEVLLPAGPLRDYLSAEEATPLELFSHVRLYNVAEKWALMDTVGLGRFFLPDAEVLVERDQDPNAVADFLRGLSGYLIENGPVIEDGHTVDGPFGGLVVHAREESLSAPPRPVLRLVPEGATDLPDGAL